MKLATVAAFLAAGVAVSGCATIVEDTRQSVSVTTPPAEGASCKMQNSEGTWYLTSPASIAVHRTKTDLVISCRKAGYQDASAVVSPHFNGATLGNVIAGGVVGIGIDAATGANFDYPEDIAVPMIPLGPYAAPPSGTQAAPK